jgi:hypothetical protein
MSNLIRKVRTVVTRIQQEDDDYESGGKWPKADTVRYWGRHVQYWLSEIFHANNGDKGIRKDTSE